MAFLRWGLFIDLEMIHRVRECLTKFASVIDATKRWPTRGGMFMTFDVWYQVLIPLALGSVTAAAKYIAQTPYRKGSRKYWFGFTGNTILGGVAAIAASNYLGQNEIGKILTLSAIGGYLGAAWLDKNSGSGDVEKAKKDADAEFQERLKRMGKEE